MQNRAGDRQRQFSRRAAILTGGKFALLTALVARLSYLQVIESDRFQMLAADRSLTVSACRWRSISRITRSW